MPAGSSGLANEVLSRNDTSTGGAGSKVLFVLLPISNLLELHNLMTLHPFPGGSATQTEVMNDQAPAAPVVNSPIPVNNGMPGRGIRLSDGAVVPPEASPAPAVTTQPAQNESVVYSQNDDEDHDG